MKRVLNWMQTPGVLAAGRSLLNYLPTLLSHRHQHLGDGGYHGQGVTDYFRAHLHRWNLQIDW